jgi:hypothetical protein
MTASFGSATPGSPPVSKNMQAQLDALAGAHCREIVVQTASRRGERPKLYATIERRLATPW